MQEEVFSYTGWPKKKTERYELLKSIMLIYVTFMLS